MPMMYKVERSHYPIHVIERIADEAFFGEERYLPHSQQQILNGITDSKAIYRFADRPPFTILPNDYVMVDVATWERVVALAKKYLPEEIWD